MAGELASITETVSPSPNPREVSAEPSLRRALPDLVAAQGPTAALEHLADVASRESPP